MLLVNEKGPQRAFRDYEKSAPQLNKLLGN